MSPEFYAIIGVGISLAGFVLGLMIYFNNQTNKRLDWLVAKYDQLVESGHSLDLRVSKLEWMLNAALHGTPVIQHPATPRPEPSANPQPAGNPAKEKAAAKRRLRRRTSHRPQAASESSAS